MATELHKVRLTHRPDEEVEVSGRELLDLTRRGLVVAAPAAEPAPVPPSPSPRRRSSTDDEKGTD